MKLGVVYPQIELGGDPNAVRRFALAAEALGYDHLLAYDHVVGASHDREPRLWGPYTDQDPFHDPLIMFAYLAGLTQKLEFATGVIILPQRQTALVARQVADLDLLSGERLRFGIGVGWNYVEYQALGQDFATRGARADEQIALLRRYWSESLVTFKGRFDEVDRGNILPRPRRRIPIWIGGFQEPAFKRGGYLGDGFIFAGQDPLAHLARVKHHLKEAGRALDGYGLDFITNVSRSVDETVNAAQLWRETGGTHLSVCTMGMGLKSVEAHIDFIGQVKVKLAS
jgi:probable F420-dependent oxidoreductase